MSIRKKILWLVVSCIMALSLVIASCGPAEEEEEVETGEEEVIITGEEEEEAEEEVVEEEGLPGPEVPKYGGVYTNVLGGYSQGFDPYYNFSVGIWPDFVTNEGLINGDWALGPAGSGVTDWAYGWMGHANLLIGHLAESWDLPDSETIVFHIRHGVHYALNPNSEASVLVGGREMTAEDVAWNLMREWTSPNSFPTCSNPPSDFLISAEATDKYTVVCKVPSHVQIMLHLLDLTGIQIRVRPPEVADVYGDYKDWRNSVGTGWFMLTDYIPDSALVYEKNPNYWMVDPIHPENQLPYLDGMRTIIIADLSTQLAAFRTGKIDMMQNITWEDQKIMMEQRSDLEYFKRIGGLTVPFGRVDKEELPFKDIRVRQALNLAVNQVELRDDFYEGNADLLGYPFNESIAHEKVFTPLEELSPETQELFTYNPEKAKQLLTEAGYPDGFKTQIECMNSEVDRLSIVRDYLLDVDVDMEIRPLEGSIYYSVNRGRTFEEMGTAFTYPTFVFKLQTVRAEAMGDPSFWRSDLVDEVYREVVAVLGVDDAEADRLMKSLADHLLLESWGIWLPVPYAYTAWQPWVQNFYGAQDVGYYVPNCFTKFIWYDEALKKSKGY